MAQIAEEEWGGEIHVYEDRAEIDRALGTGRQELGLLSVWWESAATGRAGGIEEGPLKGP